MVVDGITITEKVIDVRVINQSRMRLKTVQSLSYRSNLSRQKSTVESMAPWKSTTTSVFVTLAIVVIHAER